MRRISLITLIAIGCTILAGFSPPTAILPEDEVEVRFERLKEQEKMWR